jgi:TonB-linked SusC/RagA family outer membrane protein
MNFFLNKIYSFKQKHKGLVLFMLLCFTAVQSLFAQNQTGKVVSETGEPLVGVTVKIKDTAKGALTDEAGNFTIELIPNVANTLIFSYLGYEEQMVRLDAGAASKNPLNVAMKPSSTSLNSVVIVGYGSRSKRELTGSVASVTSKDIKEQSVTSFDQALVGKMAGVQVFQTTGTPGGSVSIRIRGINSISAGSNPLFVIDGVPISNDTRSASGGANGYEQPFNPLSSINPSDIESIDVLKDAASAAIYGSRGSTGVVLITTKKGKSGRLTVNYDGSYGVQEVEKYVKVLDAYQYAQTVYDGHNNAYFDVNPNGLPTDPNSVRGSNPATHIPPQILPYLAGQQGLTNTNWQKEIFRQAPMQNHTISIGGGNENATFLFSGNYFNQEGIVINNDLKRYSSRFRVDAKANKFKFGANFNPSYSENNAVSSEGPWASALAVGGIVATAVGYSPLFPVYNPDGTFTDSVNTWGYGQTNQLNPVAMATLMKDKIKNFRLLATTYADYEIVKGLNYRLTLASDINSFRRDFFRPSNLPTQGLVGPSVATGFSNTNQYVNWLAENTLNYSKIFDLHKVDVIAGYSAQKENQDFNSVTANNFPTNAVSTVNAGQIASGSSTTQQWSLLSYLTRVQYSYDGRYLLSASIRRDGSSRFGKNNKWATFPAASAAWVVSNERFFEKVKAITNLKIRASYGLTGNFQIPNYGSLAQLNNTNSNYILGNGSLVNGISVATAANPDLSWENTASADMGIELGFFENAINFTFDIYKANTTDLLLNLPVAGASGFSSYLQNIGAMTNKGIELGINYNKRWGNWGLEGNANYTTNKNEVTKLGPSGAPIIQTGGTGNTYYITQIGQPISSYYVYNVIGIYKDAEDLANSAKTTNTTKVGDFKFEDVNADGKIDANDRKIVGNYLPDFTFGFSNTVRYKGLDLSFAIQGSYGAEVMALAKRHLANVEGNFNNITEILDYYKSPTDQGSGYINRANRLATGGNGITSSWHVEDASYLRIRNIGLGYNVPANLINKARISVARVYANVQNVHTFTKYPFFNPETNNRPDNSLIAGEDYGSYPLARTYTLGLNVTF